MDVPYCRFCFNWFDFLTCRCRFRCGGTGYLRNNICTIGKASVQKNCIIPVSFSKSHPVEIAAMERHGMLARVSKHGHFSLTPVATVSLTVVENPVSVQETFFANMTAYEARAELIRRGWQTVEQSLNCSVSLNRMMRYQTKEYYILILCAFDQLVELPDNQCFAHSQKRLYYETLALICAAEPFDSRIE